MPNKKPAPPIAPPPRQSTTLLVKPDVATGRDPYADFVRTLPHLPTGVPQDGYPGGPSSAIVDELRVQAGTSGASALRLVRLALKEVSDLLTPGMLNRTSRSGVRRRILEACKAMREAQAPIGVLNENAKWLSFLALPEQPRQANVDHPEPIVTQLPQGPQISIPALARLLDRPAPKQVVIHHLHHGTSLCGISRTYGVPQLWPEGNKWSADWTDVNCIACAVKAPPDVVLLPDAGTILHYIGADGSAGCSAGALHLLRGAPWPTGHNGVMAPARVSCEACKAFLAAQAQRTEPPSAPYPLTANERRAVKLRVHLRLKRTSPTSVCGKKMPKGRGNAGTFWTLEPGLADCGNCKRVPR
jgi:hypothetical protein